MAQKNATKKSFHHPIDSRFGACYTDLTTTREGKNIMKKLVVFLLCLATFLSLVACNGIGNSDDTDSTENTNEETTKANDASNGESNSTLSELTQLRAEPTKDLPEASIWQAKSEKEYYVYIKDWEVYRKLPELASYNSMHVNDNCIMVNSETATISIIHLYGKHDRPVIITYHFNRQYESVETHIVELDIIANSEADIQFINWQSQNIGYFFWMPGFEAGPDWPLVRFETNDGGKSWNNMSTQIFDLRSSDIPEIVKFVSSKVGIISFRYVNINDLCDRTYLTVDGGLTWNKISQLPYPFEDMYSAYSEVVNLEMGDTGNYYLTVEVRGRMFSEEYSVVQIKFWSEDLIKWRST